MAGQQLLDRKSETRIAGPDTVGAGPVCTVAETTSGDTVRARLREARLISRNTYTECVRMLLRSEVAAVTTDDAILLGYAAQQPDKLKVVGEPFTEEKYGIGYRLHDRAFCQFLTDAITAAQRDGSWGAAFDRTLGRAGVPRPPVPPPDTCPA